MSEEFRPPVRVNTRISAKYNDWLDKRSKESSVSKSALINLAVENYIMQAIVTGNMEEMLEKTKGLEDLEEIKLDLKMLKEKINS